MPTRAPRRRVVLFVASSLDGYIARKDGGVDWLFTDGDYGLRAFFRSIDTVLMGRKTYDVMVAFGEKGYRGLRNIVFTRRPRMSDVPNLEFTSEDPGALVGRLRRSKGKDIWLCGGGELFAACLEAGVVDVVRLAVHPILLGDGIPLFREREEPVALSLRRLKRYRNGLLDLEYDVVRTRRSRRRPAPRRRRPSRA